LIEIDDSHNQWRQEFLDRVCHGLTVRGSCIVEVVQELELGPSPQFTPPQLGTSSRTFIERTSQITLMSVRIVWDCAPTRAQSPIASENESWPKLTHEESDRKLGPNPIVTTYLEVLEGLRHPTVSFGLPRSCPSRLARRLAASLRGRFAGLTCAKYTPASSSERIMPYMKGPTRSGPVRWRFRGRGLWRRRTDAACDIAGHAGNTCTKSEKRQQAGA
jgi:hypothetical protein